MKERSQMDKPTRRKLLQKAQTWNTYQIRTIKRHASNGAKRGMRFVLFEEHGRNTPSVLMSGKTRQSGGRKGQMCAEMPRSPGNHCYLLGEQRAKSTPNASAGRKEDKLS